MKEHADEAIRTIHLLLEPHIHTDPPPGDNLWDSVDFGGYGDY